MGLDFVEIVMAVEESFGVRLNDSDVQVIATVGDLHDLIVSKTDSAASEMNLRDSTFYLIQSGLDSCGINDHVEPATQVGLIIPEAGRRANWVKLSRTTRLRFPDLLRPKWMTVANYGITLSAATAVTVFASRSGMPGVAVLSSAAVSLPFFAFITAAVTTPFATDIKSDIATFGDLAESLVGLNTAVLVDKFGPIGRKDTWVVLRELIVKTLGVDHDEVVREAEFVKDLGCE